jgi:Uma2 family endonuclease
LIPEQPCGSLTLLVPLSGSLRLTPEQFAELCQANPEAVLEPAADGSLIPMTPTGSETGALNANLLFQIQAWMRAAGGWKVFDSSTGFRLPDNSVLSPDVSLVDLDRWQALSGAGAVASRRSAPIWWWNWQVPAMTARAGSPHCARRWPPTSATAPGWAGC